jgi:hypothetical protein
VFTDEVNPAPEELEAEMREAYDAVVELTRKEPRYVKEGEIEVLLQRLLALAQLNPLEWLVHIAIDMLYARMQLVGADLRFSAPQIDWLGGYHAVSEHLPGDPEYFEPSGLLGFLLYSLPQLRLFDETLLPTLVEPSDGRLRSVETHVSIPDRILLPLQNPTWGRGEGYDFDEPSVCFDGRVLQIEQKNRFKDKFCDGRYDIKRVAAYRICGHLIHARSLHLQWYEAL